MYRQIFIPNEQNSNIPIPREWYGRKIEVIAFPVMEDVTDESVANKRKKLDEVLNQHLINLKDFRFNRDEANDYD
jgi:hypothetical protein